MVGLGETASVASATEYSSFVPSACSAKTPSFLIRCTLYVATAVARARAQNLRFRTFLVRRTKNEQPSPLPLNLTGIATFPDGVDQDFPAGKCAFSAIFRLSS